MDGDLRVKKLARCQALLDALREDPNCPPALWELASILYEFECNPTRASEEITRRDMKTPSPFAAVGPIFDEARKK